MAENNLLWLVKKYLKKRVRLIELTHSYKPPFYVFDEEEFDSNVSNFKRSFSQSVDNLDIYYAIKLNHHPSLVKRAVELGLGLDVASSRELEIAINTGAEKIVYFAPGRSIEDFELASKYSNKVIVNFDSFSDLKKMGEISNRIKNSITCGVRVCPPVLKTWSKYGIPLDELLGFWKLSHDYPYLNLVGVHFHSSRNSDASNYKQAITQLGKYLKKYFTRPQREEIRFIDFGGGFEQYNSEGIYDTHVSSGAMNVSKSYQVRKSLKINEYAEAIGKSVVAELKPILPAVRYFTEPGRILCNSAMHIILKVEDISKHKAIVVNGGVNMVGWQRFEYEYFPIINLTNSALKELPITIYGNLCTTWDIWGYHCYSSRISVGDIILVPNQGALTYSLAQNFINPIPPVIILEKN